MVAACGPRYFGVRNGQTTAVPEFADPTPLEADAVNEIARASTVAFFPPDACLDRRAAPSGTTTDEQVLRLQCGSVMTNLEKAAIDAGFQVVSWQSLRGTQQPIEYAKERDVELLFEINELDTVEVRDRDSAQTLSFFEHRGANDDASITVDANVANRCRAAFGGGPGVSGLAASLDVKMVSVGTGRVLWSYRKTRNAELGVRGGVKYYESHKPTRAWAWVLVGLGALTLGAAIASEAPSGPAYLGAATIGVGVLGLVLRSHESPNDVLCNRVDVPDPFALAVVRTPAAREESGSSFTYASQVRARDPLQELRMALVRDLVSDFTGQLRGARR